MHFQTQFSQSCEFWHANCELWGQWPFYTRIWSHIPFNIHPNNNPHCNPQAAWKINFTQFFRLFFLMTKSSVCPSLIVRALSTGDFAGWWRLLQRRLRYEITWKKKIITWIWYWKELSKIVDSYCVLESCVDIRLIVWWFIDTIIWLLIWNFDLNRLRIFI